MVHFVYIGIPSTPKRRQSSKRPCKNVMGMHTDKSIVVTMCVKQPDFTVCTCICVALEDTGDNEETVETPTSK